MATPAAVGQLYQVSVVARCLGQRILNVFHYRLEVLPAAISSETAAGILKDELILAGNVVDKLSSCCPENWLMEQLWIQVIRPTRLAKFVYTQSGTGARADTDACNIAASITKAGEESGRQRVGRMQVLIGTAPTEIAIGFVSGAVFGALSNLATQLKAQVGNGVDETTWRPVIYNRSFIPQYTYITRTDVKSNVRTMHRRTVGLGE